MGTLIMAPARCLVNTPDRLTQAIKTLAVEGTLPAALGETDDPLGFLVHEGGADSLMDAAYRYARHTSGAADIVLFGTGDLAHLEANIAALPKPALPRRDVDRLTGSTAILKASGWTEADPNGTRFSDTPDRRRGAAGRIRHRLAARLVFFMAHDPTNIFWTGGPHGAI